MHFLCVYWKSVSSVFFEKYIWIFNEIWKDSTEFMELFFYKNISISTFIDFVCVRFVLILCFYISFVCLRVSNDFFDQHRSFNFLLSIFNAFAQPAIISF